MQESCLNNIIGVLMPEAGSQDVEFIGATSGGENVTSMDRHIAAMDVADAAAAAANEDEEKDLFGSDGGRACRPTGQRPTN